jgi:hypothetical protein
VILELLVLGGLRLLQAMVPSLHILPLQVLVQKTPPVRMEARPSQ